MTATDVPADFVVHMFPTDDAVLKERVHEVLAADPTCDPNAFASTLEQRLQAVYPQLRVRRRASLAGFGQTALYVFRDGGATAHDNTGSWIDEPLTARVVSDASGTYLAANEAAAALFGVSCAEIIGRRAGDFTRPDARVDAGALWEVLERTGRLHSFALVTAAEGVRRVEFITIKDGDGPGRNVTYLREHLVGSG